MEPEQLTLILETVQNTTGDAKTVAIAYFGFEFAKVLLTASAVLTGITIVARVVRSITCNVNGCRRTCEALYRGLPPSKRVGGFAPEYESDHSRILNHYLPKGEL